MVRNGLLNSVVVVPVQDVKRLRYTKEVIKTGTDDKFHDAILENQRTGMNQMADRHLI